MVDRRRFLAGLGALAVGSGALIQSGAFSTVKGNRGVGVQTARDTSALLGLEGVDDASTPPEFENNSSVSMDVTLESTDGSVEFDVGDTGSFTDPATFSLAPGDDKDVAINDDGDSAPVSVTAELPGSSDPQTTISLTRDYAVPAQADQADQVQLKENGNTGAPSNSGGYELELKNTGNTEVTVVGIRIEDTSTNAEEVGNKNGSTLVAGGTGVLSNSIPVDSETSDPDTRREFDPNVSLSAGASKSFEFDKFLTGNGNSGAKMKGATVEVTFFFDDGSSKRLTVSS
jgi:hypothetical protein